MLTKTLSSLPILFCFAACSIAPPGTDIHDPFEQSNRQVHAFNKSIAASFGGNDDGSDGPRIPEAISLPVINVAENLSLPGMVVNNLLQADLEGGVANTVRFLVNSTVGVLGLFDPADAIGLTEVDTDFGATLAVWGVPEGAYLELAFVGPTTERDATGDIVDIFLDPLGKVLSDDEALLASAFGIAGRVAKIDQSGDVIGDVLNESADSYAQTRLIYLQNRRFELGQDAPAAVDPYEELFGVIE